MLKAAAACDTLGVQCSHVVEGITVGAEIAFKVVSAVEGAAVASRDSKLLDKSADVNVSYEVLPREGLCYHVRGGGACTMQPRSVGFE
mgnify:CR=1 FL=1